MRKEEEAIIHSEEDFAKMRVAGKAAASILDFITDHVKVGVNTETLDQLCHDEITRQEAIPAPLNYRGFPKSICTSINHVICHGVPSEKDILRNGDIVNIDVTVIIDGWHGDTSRMYYVGKPTIKGKRLVETTYESLALAIAEVKPGNTIGDIGHAIQTYAEGKGYSVVRDYCGHGIGKVFHTAPSILHYGKKGEGLTLQEGMFFTIEPMINIGGYESVLHRADTVLPSGQKQPGYGKKNDWTVTTKDKSLSAQFEHTLGVTSNGCEVFTMSEKGFQCPPYTS